MPRAIMPTNDFNRIIKATKNFTAKNDNRKTYQYIRLEFQAEASRVTAVAIDGYRLSTEHAMCCDCDTDFVIYVRSNIRLPSNKSAVFELVDGECLIKCEDMIFGYSQPEGEFMDWQKAIPADAPTYRIGFNGEYLLSALQSAKASVGNVFKQPVVLEFRSPSQPIILRTNGEDVKMVLPVRIKEAIPSDD